MCHLYDPALSRVYGDVLVDFGEDVRDLSGDIVIPSPTWKHVNELNCNNVLTRPLRLPITFFEFCVGFWWT